MLASTPVLLFAGRGRCDVTCFHAGSAEVPGSAATAPNRIIAIIAGAVRVNSPA